MTRLINLLLVLALLAGVGILAYPTVADQYNLLKNERDLQTYESEVNALDSQMHAAMLEAARAYNATLQGRTIRDAFAENTGESEDRTYLGLLNVNGIMGVIEIPKIGVRLPIYHTTETTVLQRGIGHMEGTSLPVGGEGTHAGLSGHRGLPSAKLFSDLDKLEEGDLFYLKVLGDTLVYQVDQILTVLPHELEYLQVEEGRDLVTLVTCTPYGVNTHRLLVRGTRVYPADIAEQLAKTDAVTPMALWQSAVIVTVPLAIVLILIISLFAPRRKH